MRISATYICPVRGIAGFAPPEQDRLRQAARVVWDLDIERFLLPVFEESIMGSIKAKVQYLDGLVQALDCMMEQDLTAWLVAPAQKVLGLDWVPPHLVRGFTDPNAGQVFLEGKIRTVFPFDWWKDHSYIQKRVMLFREVAAAVCGHPALSGWVVMDRVLEWARPDHDRADLVLKCYLGEIRERDDTAAIYLGIGWSELLAPEIVSALAPQVDGIRIGGLDRQPQGLGIASNLNGEILLGAYLGALAQWLFDISIEMEIGWGGMINQFDPEEILEALQIFAQCSVAGLNWLSLIDPDPKLKAEPPWSLRPGLDRVGLLDNALEPKEHVETWIKVIQSNQSEDGTNDFIDISTQEYMDEPQTHFSRLWDHFQESI
jgi:hypothetical protein